MLKVKAGTGAAETLVRVNKWLQTQAGRSHQHTLRMRVNSDLVEEIAAELVGKTRGTERRVLSQSLQEAIYYAVRFETDIDFDEINARLTRYLHRWGTRSFVRRFLSLFFFNFIRVHAGEAFRASAGSSAEFEKSVEEIDLVCQQTVASVWKSFERTNRPLDLRAAKKLVSDIEQRLHGI